MPQGVQRVETEQLQHLSDLLISRTDVTVDEAVRSRQEVRLFDDFFHLGFSAWGLQNI